jgi:hypothetical protein
MKMKNISNSLKNWQSIWQFRDSLRIKALKVINKLQMSASNLGKGMTLKFDIRNLGKVIFT